MSVYGTITYPTHTIRFSWQSGVSKFIAAVALTPRVPLHDLAATGTDANAHIQPRDCLATCVPNQFVTQNRWYANINASSITYAFRPQLRID